MEFNAKNDTGNSFHNGQSKIKIEVPLRIDFCGGFTDVKEINSLMGTSIANIAIDVYEDAERSQKVNFYVVLGNGCLEKQQGYESTKYSCQLNALTAFYQSPVNFSDVLEVNINFPISTGLGTSGALSVLLIVAANIYNTGTLKANYDSIFQDAKRFESDFINIKGGCQDFISAINGGYNFISIPMRKLDEIDVFHRKVPESMQSYINENVLLVCSTRMCTSDQIVNDIVSHINKHQDLLKKIKAYNEAFNKCVFSRGGLEGKFGILSRLINESSLLRNSISVYSENNNLATLRQKLSNLCCCSHNTGAGGGCLVLYGIKKYRNRILKEIELLSEKLDIKCFFPRINNNGVSITNIAS